MLRFPGKGTGTGPVMLLKGDLPAVGPRGDGEARPVPGDDFNKRHGSALVPLLLALLLGGGTPPRQKPAPHHLEVPPLNARRTASLPDQPQRSERRSECELRRTHLRGVTSQHTGLVQCCSRQQAMHQPRTVQDRPRSAGSRPPRLPETGTPRRCPIPRCEEGNCRAPSRPGSAVTRYHPGS